MTFHGDSLKWSACSDCVDPYLLLRCLTRLVEGNRLQLQLLRVLDLLNLESRWPFEEVALLLLVVQVALNCGQSATVEHCALYFALPSLILSDQLVEEVVRVDVLIFVLLRPLLVLLLRALALLILNSTMCRHWCILTFLKGVHPWVCDLLGAVEEGTLVAIQVVHDADFHNLIELLQNFVARLEECVHLLLEEVCVIVLELIEAVWLLDTLLESSLGDELGYVLGQGFSLVLNSIQVFTVLAEELFELVEGFIFSR